MIHNLLGYCCFNKTIMSSRKLNYPSNRETKINCFWVTRKCDVPRESSLWVLASGLAGLPSNISDPSASNILPSAACLVVIKRIAADRQRGLGSWQRQPLNFMRDQIIRRRAQFIVEEFLKPLFVS